MNAAAKFLQERSLSRHGIMAVLFTRTQLGLSLFLFVIFMSAFSIIYTTNAARDLHADLYQERNEYNHLYAEQGQLLLERSTLGMQVRVQQIAERALNMIVPDHQMVVMIRE